MIKSTNHISLNRTSLYEFLLKNEFRVEDHPEQDQILLKVKVETYDFPLFLRPLLEGELLQLLTFIPCPIKSECFPDLARLLHTLNRDMEMPGLGMDENAPSVFYRCMAPTFGKEISEQMLLAYINTSQNVVNAFAPVIAAIANGKTTFAEVLKHSQEASSEIEQPVENK